MNITFHLSEIKSIAAELWQKFNQHTVWAFSAPMGAGKTTLIHALCDLLQVSSAVTSPTFAIINEYESNRAGTIYHMDWYRLKNAQEGAHAGCEDCIESNKLCFIEWPENASALLPYDTLFIYLEIINLHERRLIVNVQSTKY